MSGWTEDRVGVLKKLWREGLSAAQIAKQLGGVTRNSVIGKVHRLGLTDAGRATPSRPARLAAARVPPAARVHRATIAPPRPPRPAPLPPIDLDKIETIGVPINKLERHACRWPIGDPLSDTFGFCGRKAGDEGPYCVEHARVAYQPIKRRTRNAPGLARSLRRYI